MEILQAMKWIYITIILAELRNINISVLTGFGIGITGKNGSVTKIYTSVEKGLCLPPRGGMSMSLVAHHKSKLGWTY